MPNKLPVFDTTNNSVRPQATSEAVLADGDINLQSNDLLNVTNINGASYPPAIVGFVENPMTANMDVDGFSIVNTNVTTRDMTVAPTAAGALKASTTGNTRGQYAVDLQTDRTATTEVASGDRSVVLGGSDNTASAADSAVVGGEANGATAAHSFVGGGNLNVASGTHSSIPGGFLNKATAAFSGVYGGQRNEADSLYSVCVGGVFAETANEGEVAFGGNAAAASAGGNQGSVFCVYASTTDATQTNMQDANANNITIPDDTAWKFTASVVGIKDDGSEAGMYEIVGGVRKDGVAAAVFVGTPTVSVIGEDDSAWDVTSAIANSTLTLKVTGVAATNINWTGRIDVTQVKA